MGHRTFAQQKMSHEKKRLGTTALVEWDPMFLVASTDAVWNEFKCVIHQLIVKSVPCKQYRRANTPL